MGVMGDGPLKWVQRRSLRGWIASSLAALIFLLAGVMGGLIGQSAVHQAREQVGQSLSGDAQRLAERLGTELSSRARELSLIASADVVQDLPSTVADAPGLGVLPKLTPALAHTQSLLDSLRHSFPSYVAISLADTTGRILASTDALMLGQEVSARVSPRDTRHGPALPPTDGAQPRSPTIDLRQPIRTPDGTVVGVIAAQLAWSWIRGIERAVVTPDADGVVRHETFLVDSQDMVVLGPPGSVGQSLALSVSNRARAGFFGASLEQWPDGGAYLTGTALVAPAEPDQGGGSPNLRWVVLIREGEAAAFAGAYALRSAIWMTGIAIAASFAVLGWFLAGMISAPLVRIAQAAERLRQGDDIEIPRLRGSVEIETMSTSLRAMVATLTRKQLALSEMEELALRDPLTGLLNRHGLRLVMQKLFDRALEEHSCVMIFMGDLDGFKAVNDSLGHANGDALLCQVANRLSRAVRGDDVVARLGGDEFVLALLAQDGPDDRDAHAVALRAQQAIAAPFKIGGTLVRVGCSLGGACWPEDIAERDGVTGDAAGFEEVLECADMALYHVKRSGKGRIALHRRPLPEVTSAGPARD